MDEEVPENIKQIIKDAVEMRLKAHCPYSNFRVGSAVLSEDEKTIFKGANVENASYGLSVCAERIAIFNAVTSGYKKFKAIAICCDLKNTFGCPCGACRQVMAEFGYEMDVYLVKPDYSWKKTKLTEILPNAFYPDRLSEERQKD